MKNEEEHADEKMLANDRAGRRRCCGVCCSYYERVVAVLLPICGLLNLSFASSIGWTWGIVVGFFGLLLGSAVMYRVYSAMIKSAIVHNRSHKAAMLVLVTTVADVVFPYMLTTAMIQAMPQGRYPQWPGLRKDGFPTACRPAARNCVRLGNDTDVYASDNLKAPVLGGSRVQVLDAIEDWVRNQNGKVLFRSEYVVRARLTTFLMGYQDDIAAHVACLDKSRLQLNLQSQSRLGVGDMGANFKRLRALIQFLQATCPSSGNIIAVNALFVLYPVLH
jgi:uncharacterized protein (DUF1499 family)